MPTDRRPPRRRGANRAALHLAAGVLMVGAVPAWLPDLSADRRPSPALQVAKDSHSPRGKLSEDIGLDSDEPWSQPASPKVGKSIKSAPGGYDQRRIKRFWSHYHGARPAKKPKPLEHER